MATKKKVKTKTFRSEEDLKLIAILNKAKEVCHTVLECGSAFASDVHELDNMVHRFGTDKGYKKENWYSDFE
jgi:hypothetical protein|tara:strand:+ start:603 stop:818 length:216 start_codon:yes stop_codon:yes gene_type:complete